MYRALIVFSRTITIFGMVARRGEFWMFMLMHIGLTVVNVSGVTAITNEIGQFKWEALGATQFFMTFFITFYNGNCFSRFLKLYDLCMDAVDGMLNFVHELVVSLEHAELQRHRTCATKYVLAILYVFFMGVTGGALAKAEWREIVKKGLLTKDEADQLANYPARSTEASMVLASWVMQIVDQGLTHDKCWGERSLRVAHTHNRLNKHLCKMLDSCHQIGDIMALPIPFPYFHVMNLVLVFNLLMMGIVMSTFGTYATIIPFTLILLFFIGLREISSSLADPFGPEDIDFPIAAFLENTFDQAICHLESFNLSEHQWAGYVEVMTGSVKDFKNLQLRHETPEDLVYQKNYDPVTSSPFAWSKEMPMQAMAGDIQGPQARLREAVFTVARSHQDGTVVEEEESEEEEEEEVVAIPFWKKCCGAKMKPKKHGMDKKQQSSENKLQKKRDELEKAKAEKKAKQEEVKKLQEACASLEKKIQDFKDKGLTPQAPKHDQQQAPKAKGFNSFGEARERIRLALGPEGKPGGDGQGAGDDGKFTEGLEPPGGNARSHVPPPNYSRTPVPGNMV